MNLLQTLEAEQILALGQTIPDFAPGDTVRVGYKVTEGTPARACRPMRVCASRATMAPVSARASRCARSPLARA